MIGEINTAIIAVIILTGKKIALHRDGRIEQKKRLVSAPKGGISVALEM